MAEPRSIFEVQLELLNNELKSIDGAIRQHDDITKTVKNWAVVTWTASMGFVLKEKNLQPYLWLTAVIPVVFWIVDGSFRRIQRSFIARVEQISKYVNSAPFVEAAKSGSPLQFQLLAMRIKTGEFRNSLLGTMLFRSVALLYLGLTLCSLVIWFVKG